VLDLKEFEKYTSCSDTFTPPPVPPDYNSWIEEPDYLKGSEQFLTLIDNVATLNWCEPKTPEKPKVICSEKISLLPDSHPILSPKGSFIGFFTKEGLTLYCGSDLKNKAFTLPHRNATQAVFSPNEQFVATMVPNSQNSERPIIIWDVLTKRSLFFLEQSGLNSQLQFSSNGNYCARLELVNNTETVVIYSTKTLKKIRNPFPNMPSSFSFSPKKDYIAIFIQATKNTPSIVAVYDIANNFRLIRSFNVFNVITCSFRWSPCEGFLCTKIDMKDHDKQGKEIIVSNLLFFRLCLPDVPTELVELKENLLAFDFEPHDPIMLAKNPKLSKQINFAVIHTVGNNQRGNVSFYTIENKAIHLQYKLEKSVSRLYWNPRGKIVILADKKSGSFEIFNSETQTSIAKVEHINTSNVMWEPLGRFFILFTQFSQSEHSDSGYDLYHQNGTMISHIIKQGFYSFNWRPRPENSLPQKDKLEIINNLKEIRAKYKEEDKKEESQAKTAAKEERQRRKEEIDRIAKEGLFRYLDEQKIRNKLANLDESFIPINSYSYKIIQ